MNRPATTNDDAAGTVVLGTAVGYSPDQVAPFLLSLRRTGYKGRVVLLMDQGSYERLSGDPRFAGIGFVRTPRGRLNTTRLARRRAFRIAVWHPFFFLQWLLIRLPRLAPVRRATRARLQLALAKRVMHPQLSRYLFYAEFLRSDRSERVLLSDVRDVVFQTNPSDEMLSGGCLGVGLETRENSIASEYWNRVWIRTGYGSETLARIGDRPISCAGVTFGDRQSVTRYLDLMVEEVLSCPPRMFLRRGDQAMHNYLLWTEKLGAVHLLDTFASPVATLNGVREGELLVNAGGQVLNRDGSLVSIVHQYDRVPGLDQRLLASVATAPDQG